MREKPSKDLGIYVHIPFCVKKCRYCDFNSFAGKSESAKREYVAKLMAELSGRSRAFRNDYTVNSIFIGGGTPSTLEPYCIEEIMDCIYSLFRVAPDSENTIEANPGTADGMHFRKYLDSGINRLSLGIQSFDKDKRGYLGRVDTRLYGPEVCFGFARRVGFLNISIDLMFGVPGEAPGVWENDVKMALKLNPEHISFYSLQVEEGTEVYRDISEGRAEPLTDVEDRLMYHHAVETLAAAGYVHYEISNAAKEGYASRHNLKYWSMRDYLGVGLGAHSYIDGVRFANTEDWNEYIIAGDHRMMTKWTHKNSLQEDISEYVFLGLRRLDGVDTAAFRDRFNKDFLEIYGFETEGLLRRGLVVFEDGKLRLTPLGIDLSNQVFMEYI